MNIFELSSLGINVDDHFLSNILYDGIDFKFIDTASYYYFTYVLNNNYGLDDTLVIYKENVRRIMKILFSNITDKYYCIDNFIYAFLQEINSPYKDYLMDLDLMVNPDKQLLE